MRPRKLTDQQLAHIRSVIAARKALPTNAALARENGISKSLVDQIASGVCYKTFHVAPTTKLHDVLVELGLESPYKDSTHAQT